MTDELRIPPEALATGIEIGAVRALRRELKLLGAVPLTFVVDPEIPDDEMHVYVAGELQLKITNIGGH